MSLPRCFGVLGDPVAHSRSPAMHAAAFAALGLPHHYLAFHVDAAGLPAALAGARALGFGGLSVTVPHKQAAAALCDELTPTARRIGAVNTIVLADAGLCGDNTDGLGFAAAVGELAGGAIERAVILGGGGAALAVVDAVVHTLQVADVRWVTRDPAALRATRAPAAGVRVIGYAELAAGPLAADLLVHCTTVGMRGGPRELPVALALDSLRPGARVVDIVYPRPVGGLLDRAADAGFAVQDGLPMLLWQGVRALERWLARPLPADAVAAMRAALAG
jgi:shikimate dehydrogenase